MTATTHHLTHVCHGWAIFRPAGDVVEVERRHGTVHRWTLPLVEARRLYARLVRTGWVKW